MTVWFLIFFWIRSVKNGSNLIKLLARNGFLAVMAFLQKLLFVQKHLCQIWNGFLAQKRFFSNESALLLKALKGLARLWWLKAFRLVFKKTQFVAEFLKNSDWLSSRLFLWKKKYLVFQFPRLRKNIRLLGCSEFASNLKVERRIMIYEFDEIGRYFEKGPYGAFGA